jgi:hypothetical protein
MDVALDQHSEVTFSIEHIPTRYPSPAVPVAIACRRTGGPTSRHLDSISAEHHDARMRTTVTLDTDVVRLLRDAMHRSRQSFKEALNGALRTGLSAPQARPKPSRFVVKARPMGVRAGIDPTRFNTMADDLEVEAVVAKARRARRS